VVLGGPTFKSEFSVLHQPLPGACMARARARKQFLCRLSSTKKIFDPTNHPFPPSHHRLDTTIHLLLLYRTMATPTEFFIPPPTAEDLIGRLEEAANRQKAATPEITFDDEVEQCFEWLCEEERPKFQPNEIDKLRTKIADLGVTKHDISGDMETYVGTSLYMGPEFWNRKQALYQSSRHVVFWTHRGRISYRLGSPFRPDMDVRTPVDT
jgi:hypothetical protein